MNCDLVYNLPNCLTKVKIDIVMQNQPTGKHIYSLWIQECNLDCYGILLLSTLGTRIHKLNRNSRTITRMIQCLQKSNIKGCETTEKGILYNLQKVTHNIYVYKHI